MTININVKCKVPNGLQTAFILLNGSNYHNKIEIGNTVVDIETWLKVKSSSSNLIANGAISVDKEEENSAINLFKEQCFSEFQLSGVPSIKASTLKGELSSGVRHPIALEWLESKEEYRASRRDEREEESLSISRKALLISQDANTIASKARDNAKWANRIALVAILFSIIAASTGSFSANEPSQIKRATH